MNHYTLAEHRTFCIESGIQKSREWQEVGKLGWLPEGIYSRPDKQFNQSFKDKHNASQRTPEKRRIRNAKCKEPAFIAKKSVYDKKRYKRTLSDEKGEIH